MKQKQSPGEKYLHLGRIVPENTTLWTRYDIKWPVYVIHVVTSSGVQVRRFYSLRISKMGSRLGVRRLSRNPTPGARSECMYEHTKGKFLHSVRSLQAKWPERIFRIYITSAANSGIFRADWFRDERNLVGMEVSFRFWCNP